MAEISFAERTPDGGLRHASYQGLRADKPARSVVREVAKAPPDDAPSPNPAKCRTLAGSPSRPAATSATTATAPPATAPSRRSTSMKAGTAEVEGVRITPPEHVIDAASGHTKLDLARYYAGIAPWMIPHMKARPASLVRAPEGVGGEPFFQKHADVRTMPGVLQLSDLWEGHGPLL